MYGQDLFPHSPLFRNSFTVGIFNPSYLFLFYFPDYVSGGELFTHLYNREHFTEDEAMFYTAEVAVALDFLHKVTNKNK